MASQAGAQTVYTEAAHSGSYYGATSTASGGGGTFEDVPLSTSPGQLICGSAWLRTQYPATGAAGSLVLWLLGGSSTDSGRVDYTGLSNLGNWSQVHACVEATAAHTTLRIQFYPNPGSPTVDMDDVDVHTSLAVNGGFENGSGPWAPYPGTASNYVDYSSSSASQAQSGSHFAATNTTQAGGGIYEDVALSTSPGQLICGSAWLRTEGAATGAAGSFALWLLGGSSNESGTAAYGGLGNGADWSPVHTCVEATTAHSTLRIQFYPNAGSPTVEIDDVDVGQSLAVNGGFEDGSGPWAPYPGTGSNYVDYPSSSAGQARSGSHFGATNTAADGGGIYEDVALSTSPGQLVCGSAWLRTEGAATGAAGSLVLWLLGGSANDAGRADYAGLGNGGNWSEVQTCVEATGSHSTLRIQLYPNPGSPTVEIDDVDVHGSLAANGGFEYGSGPWGTYPNTDSSYDAYRTGQVTGPATPVVKKPVKTRLPRSRARHALKVKVYLSWTWSYRITRLNKATIGSFPRRTRLTVLCAGRRCPREAKASAAGARPLRRLLRGLDGTRYRVGQRLRITLTAPAYRAERAEVIFRYGRQPLARLLSR